jgi:hypothetical protein
MIGQGEIISAEPAKLMRAMAAEVSKDQEAIDAANNDILKRQGEIGCGGPRITDPLSPEMSATLAGKVGQCYESTYFKNTLLKNISDSLK